MKNIKLDLQELLNCTEEGSKMETVFRIAADMGYILNGCLEHGVLINNKIEEVLLISNIDLVISCDEVSIFACKKTNKLYIVDLIKNTCECKEERHHINFNTLREIKSLKNTFVAPIVYGGILNYVVADTDINRIEKIVYNNCCSPEDFEHEGDDCRIFNLEGDEVKSLYPEIEYEESTGVNVVSDIPEELDCEVYEGTAGSKEFIKDHNQG